MILTQLRIAIAFTLTAVIGLCGEPDRPRLTEQGSLQAAGEDPLGTFRNSPVWLEEMSQPVRRRDLQLEPAASCAATACHGGPRPGIAEDLAARGAEYPLWLENDPHAQSWRTLCNETSIAMLERLSIMRGGKIVNAKAFDNCLACHNTTRGYNAASDGSKSGFHGEGVGCASCHGPSQNWRSDHYRLKRNHASNSAIGLVPNKDLVVRARVCAACHIGDSDRDMNHDIIAAGHPALHYEFATFHHMLPKHWREPEKTRSEDFEAQLWLAGQVAALDASLALLDSRVTKSLSVSTWPEFATADCSSCHQSLRLGAAESAGGARLSATTFSNWNRFGVDQLLSSSRTAGSETLAAKRLALSLDHLSRLMSVQAIPEANAVQVAARNARLDLDAWLQHSVRAEILQFSAGSLQRIAASALADGNKLKGWEFTAQAYLAVVASRSSWMSSTSATAPRDVTQLRNALLFKPETKSLAVLDEPARDIESTAASLLQSLQQGLHPPLTQTKTESSSSGSRTGLGR